MDQYVLVIIALLCGSTLVISIYKKNMDLFLNLLLRLLAGVVGIYVLNTVLSFASISNMVGINPLNVLVIGILGVPGFLLLYGLSAYFLFI